MTGYLGYGSQTWSAVWESIVFGFLIMGLSFGFGIFVHYGTELALGKSLVCGTVIWSIGVGYFIFLLHGPYVIKKVNGKILGTLRKNQQNKRLIGYCVGYVFIMSAPVIATILVQNSNEFKDIILSFFVSFIV